MAYIDKGAKGINIRDFGVKGLASEQISQATLNKVFDMAIARSRPVFFPSGTYVFPANFTYDFGFNPVHLIGEDKRNTIITTKFNTTTMKIVERVNLTKPKAVGDGFYRVDKIGVNHTDWAALTAPEIDDYIKITAGVVATATFAEIKAAGWLTELDVNLADPGIDGNYVVAATNTDVGGGGYTHSNLPYNTSVKYITGTMLTRTAGVWARMVPAHGFKFGGNFQVENLQFNDVSFYLFTPNNTTLPEFDIYSIHNCIFKHVIRINSLDRQFASTSIQSQGFMKGLNYHHDDGENFNYKTIEFIGNEFSYIHTCILWDCPPTRKLIVKDNHIHHCFTHTEMFIYLPMSQASSSGDPDDDEGYTNKTQILYENNIFDSVRHYSPVSSGGHHLMRGNGQAIYKNNRAIDFTGTAFYLAGNNNLVDGNILIPYIQNFPIKETLIWGQPAMFHIKTALTNEVTSTMIVNNRIERSAQCNPVDIKGTDSYLFISGNKLQSIGWAEPLLASDADTLSLNLKYDPKELNREKLYLIRDVQAYIDLLGITPAAWAAGTYNTGTIVTFNSAYYQCVIKATAADTLDPAADIAANALNAKWRAIVQNGYAYFDIRRATWMFWPANQNRQIAILEKNYDNITLRPINFNNNVLYGYCIVRMIDGIINEVSFDNNQIYVERDILYQSVGSQGFGSHIRTMKLTNNHIYRAGTSTTTKYYNNMNTLIANNNDFYYSTVNFDIVFRHECQWTNNRVKPWPKFTEPVNVTALGLPGSSVNSPVMFRRIAPAAWADQTYTTGAFVFYDFQVWEATADVITGDAVPTAVGSKWKRADDATLIIRGGSFDAYLARYACFQYHRINKIVVEDVAFECRMVNDWSSIFKPESEGGSSIRLAIMSLNADNYVRDFLVNSVRFKFDARTYRFLFYTNTSRGLWIDNLYIKNIPKLDAYPLNKIIYGSTNPLSVITNYTSQSVDELVDDTYTDGYVTNKYLENRVVLSLTANGSYAIPKGALIDRIVVGSTVDLTAFKIGTSNNGSEITDEPVSASDPSIYNVDYYNSSVATLYFTGITGTGATVTITIFKR